LDARRILRYGELEDGQEDKAPAEVLAPLQLFACFDERRQKLVADHWL
jgi:hypothetical protein